MKFTQLMFTDNKITEIFSFADDFRNYFDSSCLAGNREPYFFLSDSEHYGRRYAEGLA